MFMRCVGKAKSLAEKQRVLLPRDQTVVHARDAFTSERGAEMRQTDVRDEYGYRFSKHMLGQPLWKFSGGCKLTLDFTNPLSSEIANDLAEAGATTVSIAKRLNPWSKQ